MKDDMLALKGKSTRGKRSEHSRRHTLVNSIDEARGQTSTILFVMVT